MKDKVQQLVDSLREVVASVKHAAAEPELSEKRQQLSIISKSIQQLVSKGISVPEDLRKLKSNLVIEIGDNENTESLIEFIVKSLRELLRELVGEPKHTVRRQGQGRRQSREVNRQPRVSGKKPVKLQLDRSGVIPVRSWKDLLIKGTEYLLSSNPTLVSSALSIRGKKGKPMFSREGTEFRDPAKLSTGLYIESHASAAGQVHFLKRVMKLCNIPQDTLKVETE